MSESVALGVIAKDIAERARQEERVALERCEQRIRVALDAYLVNDEGRRANSATFAQLASYVLLKSHQGEELGRLLRTSLPPEAIRDWLNVARGTVLRKVAEREAARQTAHCWRVARFQVALSPSGPAPAGGLAGPLGRQLVAACDTMVVSREPQEDKRWQSRLSAS